MTIRELEIIKAALEVDIIYQKQSDKADHPALVEWLEDTEKLLRKVTSEISVRKAKQKLYKQITRNNLTGVRV
jgi:hypothetical protein